MSIFVSNDSLYRENRQYKRSHIVMKRTRLATQDKSKKCSLQQKGQKCLMGKYKITLGKQTLLLCQDHYAQYQLKQTPFLKANFDKSNSLI